MLLLDTFSNLTSMRTSGVAGLICVLVLHVTGSTPKIRVFLHAWSSVVINEPSAIPCPNWLARWLYSGQFRPALEYFDHHCAKESKAKASTILVHSRDTATLPERREGIVHSNHRGGQPSSNTLPSAVLFSTCRRGHSTSLCVCVLPHTNNNPN